MKANPKVVILAGPNGAGKSSSASELLKGALNVTEFVNADNIAQGLSVFTPEEVSLQAGRAMLERINYLAAKECDFAFETTLASRSFRRLIIELKNNSLYRSHLVFLWLKSPELALARVKSRVEMGGHSVPDEIVRRRYTAGLRNFFNLYLPIIDDWYVYDNSSETKPDLIAQGAKCEGKHIAQPEIWEMLKEKYNE